MPRLETVAADPAGRYSRRMTGAISDLLEIRLFGGLEIRRHGAFVPLPQSKKSRALDRKSTRLNSSH